MKGLLDKILRLKAYQELFIESLDGLYEPKDLRGITVLVQWALSYTCEQLGKELQRDSLHTFVFDGWCDG